MAYSYEYNSAGALYSVTDYKSDEVTMYRYDTAGNLLQAYVYGRDTLLNKYATNIFYDDQSRIATQFFTFDYIYTANSMLGAETYWQWYDYYYDDQTGNIYEINLHDDYLDGTLTFTYNKLNSLTKKKLYLNPDGEGSFYQEIDYTYESVGNLQSDRISEMFVVVRQTETSTVLSSVTYRYEYDANGNITKVYSGNLLVYQYAYDNLGQLIREDNYFLNKSYVYEYDDAGNLTLKKEYTFTTGELGSIKNRYYYTYGNSSWGDQLTSVRKNFLNADTITYDEIGNPTRVGFYNAMEDHYPYGYDLAWDGRELIQYRTFEDDGEGTVSHGTTLEYTYNADGIRTSKTVNGIKHEYYLSGSQIIAEVWTENDVEHTLIYIYDEVGSPIGLKYRNDGYTYDQFDSFFFEKNLQGDIIAIYNESGTLIGKYVYDAWGNHSAYALGSTTLENKIVNTYNPFRYRGYYYDVETGFYYLQSRYYNPEWCRFLNADIYVSTGQGLIGNNMYAYCNNNPIMFADKAGQSITMAIAGTAALKFLVTAVVAVGGLFVATEVAKNTGAPSFGDFVKQKIEDILIGILVIGAIRNVVEGTIEGATEKEESKANNQHNQAYFPDNPYMFNPRGLIRKEYEGSGNGKIIKWFFPMTKTVIFEWDEDYQYGPHYHILQNGAHTGDHRVAGEMIPEPWNSMYFGGQP